MLAQYSDRGSGVSPAAWASAFETIRRVMLRTARPSQIFGGHDHGMRCSIRIALVIAFLIVAMTARSAVPSCYCLFGNDDNTSHESCECEHDHNHVPHPTCCFEICDTPDMLQPVLESTGKLVATCSRNSETHARNAAVSAMSDPPCVSRDRPGRLLFRLHQRILC